MISTDFEARKAIIDKLGGNSATLTSIFQCELVILALYGGDPHNASNIFEADKLILSQLGGDPTKVNTVFEARKAIITRLGGSTIGISNNYEASLTHFELAGGEIPDITYYSVVFKNWDGTILYTTNVIEGHTPTYNGNIPARPSDEQYNYTFNGWTPSLGPVYGNIEYTASYTATEIPVEPVYYTVVFKNWDGTILQTSSVEEGQTAVYNGSTPARPSDSQYNYTFNGWLPSLGPVNKNIEYTASYTATAIPEPEPNIYTIKFINWNGSVLQTMQVKEGERPVYTGSTPTRPSDDQYDYTFNGWHPIIEAARRNLTYTAQYTATAIPVEPQAANYVTFTAEEAGSTLGLNKLGSTQTLEYSTDAQSWTPMTTATTITLQNINDKVYVRGMLNTNQTNSNYTQFKMTGKIAASGNCNALWNYQDLEARLKYYCGQYMFSGCTSLTTAPELPATTLVDYCYSHMFLGCTRLTAAPVLPATILASGCYYSMFFNCTKITQAPALPATTLAKGCYEAMFSGCTSLTTAPELPATTLTNNCYYNMFAGCNRLTEAPVLPATKLSSQCYAFMFSNCSKLSTIKCLATDISATDALLLWTSKVASTGTFYKATGVEWPTGTSGIPSAWTVVEL